MSVYGLPFPLYGQITLSTMPQQIVGVSTLLGANNRQSRVSLQMVSTLQFAICGSSTNTSTEAYTVPASVPFRLDASMTTGKIYGISPAGTTPLVSWMVF